MQSNIKFFNYAIILVLKKHKLYFFVQLQKNVPQIR